MQLLLVVTFVKHFSGAFSCNNINRMKTLEDEYKEMRMNNYWGIPMPKDSSFDVKL